MGELFCGAGGMSLAAKLTRQIDIVWAVDNNQSAVDTYNHNFNGKAICADAMEFCQHLEKQPEINSLAFGFPCNDFSLVGKQKGLEGKFGGLYKAGVIALNKCNPLWFVAENVSGIKSANAGKAFEVILSELENAGKFGYELTTHKYKLEEYGLPQTRHRYFIVGIRKDQKAKFIIPETTHGEGKLPFMTAGEALRGIDGDVKNNEIPKIAEKTRLRLKFQPEGENLWYLNKLSSLNDKDLLQELKQLEWFNKEFNSFSINMLRKLIEYSKVNTKMQISHIYKRLYKDKPSYTITAGGGGGKQAYHWNEHRALTNRERARLQSFPDWFEFKGNLTSVQSQIGMAVPPMCKFVFEAVLQALREV